MTGGDDAYFVNIGDCGALDLGVFDGVGGWASRGHDPGIFTRGFAKATAGEKNRNPNKSRPCHIPYAVLLYLMIYFADCFKGLTHAVDELEFVFDTR